MSEADKMFEELGYKKYENYEKTREIFICKGIDKIVFDKEYKYFTTSIINDGYYELIKHVKIKELKAINKKVQELGWI